MAKRGTRQETIRKNGGTRTTRSFGGAIPRNNTLQNAAAHHATTGSIARLASGAQCLQPTSARCHGEAFARAPPGMGRTYLRGKSQSRVFRFGPAGNNNSRTSRRADSASGGEGLAAYGERSGQYMKQRDPSTPKHHHRRREVQKTKSELLVPSLVAVALSFPTEPQSIAVGHQKISKPEADITHCQHSTSLPRSSRGFSLSPKRKVAGGSG